MPQTFSSAPTRMGSHTQNRRPLPWTFEAWSEEGLDDQFPSFFEALNFAPEASRMQCIERSPS